MIEERVTMRVPNRLLLLCLVVAAMLCLAGCDDDEMTPQSENKKGLTYYDAGDYEKAAEYFSRAIELDNSDMEVHNNYGMTLLQLRRYDEALQQFEIVLANSTALAPKKSETLNKFAIRGKGLVYIQKQNFTDALTCFNNALDIKAESGWNIDILYYKANTLECMGYRPSAIDVYTEVLKEDKENVKAYLSRANLYRIEEKYSEAIADYEKALSLAEGSYLSYIGLYTCYIQMGEKDKAKSLLEKASRLDVRTNEDRYYLGQVHYYQKNYKSAKIEMEYALDQGFSEASYFLGEIALADQKYEDAIAYFEQYRASSVTESPTVCNQEVVCYLQLFEYEKAQQMLDIGLGVPGSTARQQLLRNQAALYEVQDELQKAYDTLAEYIVQYPNDNEATSEYKFLKKRLGLSQ